MPQYVRRCSPAFSAALIADVEVTETGDEAKNALCRPVRVPEEPLDWLRMHIDSAANQLQWSRNPALRAWLRQSRLEAYAALFEQAGRQAALDGDGRWAALQQRVGECRAEGLRRLEELLAPPGGSARVLRPEPEAPRLSPA